MLELICQHIVTGLPIFLYIVKLIRRNKFKDHIVKFKGFPKNNIKAFNSISF